MATKLFLHEKARWLHNAHMQSALTYVNPIKKTRFTYGTVAIWFEVIVLSRVLYAASAWRGYLSAGYMASLQQLFANAKRWNIVASNYDNDVLLDNCDRTLFRSSLYITHCLHHLLPDKRDHTHAMTLRHPWRQFFATLLQVSSCEKLIYKSFIV